MIIELKMPALSPTMEDGTLAKWLVGAGDSVRTGDILAEIETDKATMEFEAVDSGTISQILVAEGTDGVKVGAVIALLMNEQNDTVAIPQPRVDVGRKNDGSTGGSAPSSPKVPSVNQSDRLTTAPHAPTTVISPRPQTTSPNDEFRPIKATALARRLAEQRGVNLAPLIGSGPDGLIVRSDLPPMHPVATEQAVKAENTWKASSAAIVAEKTIPHETLGLTNTQKALAQRHTESKQTIPHIYLTVDIRVDKLLALRSNLNIELERIGTILSVNDFLIKALAVALIEVPACNVQFANDRILRFSRSDVSAPVSIPGGVVTPVIVDAGSKSLSMIASEMKAFRENGRDEKATPDDHQAGTATLANMGMYGVKQFDAVISPPQAMIMAIGASEQRAWVEDGVLESATVLSATGSFDHRAIDGADGAALMAAFKNLLEDPTMLLAV